MFGAENISTKKTNLSHLTIECLDYNKQMSEKGKMIKYETKQSSEHKGSRSSTCAKRKKIWVRERIIIG